MSARYAEVECSKSRRHCLTFNIPLVTFLASDILCEYDDLHSPFICGFHMAAESRGDDDDDDDEEMDVSVTRALEKPEEMEALDLAEYADKLQGEGKQQVMPEPHVLMHALLLNLT